MTVFLLGLCTLAAVTARAEESLLDRFVWSQRVLLVFSPDDAASELVRQRALLAEGAGMLERDLVVIEVFNEQVQVAGSPSNADARSLRQRFEVGATDFAAVLVGKDGSEKRRSSKPLAACELFATIDAMPMRRGEMARAGQRAVSCEP